MDVHIDRRSLPKKTSKTKCPQATHHIVMILRHNLSQKKENEKKKKIPPSSLEKHFKGLLWTEHWKEAIKL